MKVLVHEVILTDDGGYDIIDIVDSFRNSAQGQWLNQHGYKPLESDWSVHLNANSLTTTIQHFAWLSEQDLTFYRLKWK